MKVVKYIIYMKMFSTTKKIELNTPKITYY